MVDTPLMWRHILNLPENWQELGDDTLLHLGKLWSEQKDTLHAEARQQFLKKQQRQWAIETGLIENLYTLDRGITHCLIEQGLDALDIPHNATNKSPSYVKRLIQDQQAVVEGLFDFVGNTRGLSTSYIKELHAQLARSQNTTEGIDSAGRYVAIDLLKGDWKKLPNNPTRPDGAIHEYCPPEHVASEMDQLIVWHNEHTALGVPHEVEAAWLHHRFTQIHPFQDGNGRVARALATLVFLKAGWFPLVILNDDRSEYINALEKADDGDLKPLIQFFAELAKKAFVKAISLSENVVSEDRTRHAVIAAIQKIFSTNKAQQSKSLSNAVSLADNLYNYAQRNFMETIVELESALSEIPDIDDLPEITLLQSDDDQKHYFRSQIVNFAERAEYFANLQQYHRWLQIRIRFINVRQSNIVLSLHSVSRNFSGIMTVVMFFENREAGEEMNIVTPPLPLFQTPFIFTSDDTLDTIHPQFEEWVQQSITQGLTLWQQSL